MHVWSGRWRAAKCRMVHGRACCYRWRVVGARATADAEHVPRSSVESRPKWLRPNIYINRTYHPPEHLQRRNMCAVNVATQTHLTAVRLN